MHSCELNIPQYMHYYLQGHQPSALLYWINVETGKGSSVAIQGSQGLLKIKMFKNLCSRTPTFSAPLVPSFIALLQSCRVKGRRAARKEETFPSIPLLHSSKREILLFSAGSSSDPLLRAEEEESARVNGEGNGEPIICLAKDYSVVRPLSCFQPVPHMSGFTTSHLCQEKQPLWGSFSEIFEV